MTPVSLMTAGAVIGVIATVILVVNFVGMSKRVMSFEGFSGSNIGVHLGAVAGGGWVSLLAGFVWFLVDKYA